MKKNLPFLSLAMAACCLLSGGCGLFDFSAEPSTSSESTIPVEYGVFFSHAAYDCPIKEYVKLDFKTVMPGKEDYYLRDFSVDLYSNIAEARTEWIRASEIWNTYDLCIIAPHAGSCKLKLSYKDYTSDEITFNFSDPNIYTLEFYDADGLTFIKSLTVSGNDMPVFPDLDNADFLGWSDSYEFIKKGCDKYFPHKNTTYFAVYDKVGTEGLIYKPVEGGYVVTGYNGVEYDVVIPTLYNDSPVIRIAANAFCNKGITSISIPVFVTEIGSYAFSNCKIKKCIFDKGSCLRTLCDSAFYNVRNLSSILFGKALKCAESDSLRFENYDTLICFEGDHVVGRGSAYNYYNDYYEYVVNVRQIMDKDKESRYTYLVHHDGTAEIIKYLNTEANEKIILDNVDGYSITKVRRNAFRSSDINELVVGNKVVSILSSAFADCAKLKSIDFSMAASLVKISSGAFKNCKLIPVLDLGNCLKLESIGSEAFRNCTGIRYVILPASIKTIGKYCFAGIDRLRIFSKSATDDLVVGDYWADSNCSYYINIDSYHDTPARKYTYALDTKGGAILFDYNSLDAEDIDLSQGIDGHPIVGIGTYCFEGSKITSILIPNTVRHIDRYAFHGCSDLHTVTFQDGATITHLHHHAFRDCKSLRYILLPRSITYIGGYVFEGCRDLSILFEAMDASMMKRDSDWNNEGFYVAYSVKCIHYVDHDDCGGYYYYETNLGTLGFLKWASRSGAYGPIKDLAIDQIDGMPFTYICAGAFQDCQAYYTDANSDFRLLRFTIGASVESIGWAAFAHLFEKTDSIWHLSRMSFEVVFATDSQLETISSYAFCSGELSGRIIVPKSVTKIGDYAYGLPTYICCRTIWMETNSSTNMKLGRYWNANQKVVWGTDWHYDDNHNPVMNDA